jgi:hypothetical protein
MVSVFGRSNTASEELLRGIPLTWVLLQIKKRGQRDVEIKMSGTEGIRGWG